MSFSKSTYRPCSKTKIAAILAASLTAAAAARAARGEGDKLRIETSLHFLAAIAKEIGGPEIEADALARATEDPHEVTPTPTKMVALRDADAFIENGFQLEIWDDNCIDGARNPRIQKNANGFCKAADGIATLEIPQGDLRSQGDVHPLGNPHTWFEPFIGHVYAKNIEKCLARISESKTETWTKNRKAFDRKLDEAIFGKELVEIFAGGATLEKLAHQGKLDDFLANQKFHKGKPDEKPLADLLGGLLKRGKPLKGAKLISYHKSWPYFAQTYGCEFVGEMEPKPGIPPTPGHLEELEKLAKAKGAKVVVVLSYESKPRADDFAERIGGKVALCPSDVGAEGTKDWFDFQQMLVDRIVEALPKQ